MDEYYAKLARSCLNKALDNLIAAQDYMLDGEANTMLMPAIQRLISGCRSLQDRILAAIKYKRPE